MRHAFFTLLAAGAFVVSPAIVSAQPLEPRITAVATLPGDPRIVSAAGITRTESPLLTIENGAAFDPTANTLRLVIVGGLDGDARDADAVLAAVKWIKSDAPVATRARWIVSALPMADADGHARANAFQFPPAKGFYEDPEQPESRYVWRWAAYQAPDFLIEIRNDGAAAAAPGSLTLAFRDAHAAGLGSVPTAVVSASSPPAGLEKLLHLHFLIGSGVDVPMSIDVTRHGAHAFGVDDL